MKSKKVKESKEKIYSLAQSASKSIYENKFLLEEIVFYENQLKLIKDIFLNSTEFEGDKDKLKNYITTEIGNIHNLLKTSKSKLEDEEKKLVKKLDLLNEQIFEENLPIKTEEKEKSLDNILLTYQVKQKEFQIIKMNKMIKDLENSYYSFQDYKKQKKEILVGDNAGCYYLDADLEDLTKKLNKELVYYNYNNSKSIILNSKKKNLLEKKEYFNKVINFCKGKILKMSKLFDEDKISPKKNDNAKNGKNQKKKTEFLTVSKMFDVNNEEGKAEAIIDHELHSDDEIVFEKKIKPPKKLTKDENLEKIKKLVPKIDLSMIEFNKKKVINDADLYSVKKRDLEAQDIDQLIKEMQKRTKMCRHINRTNRKKIHALENFINKLENDNKLLKKMKLQISVRDELLGLKSSDNEINKIKQELNGLEEIKEEDENELKDEIEINTLSQESVSVDEYVAYTQRSISSDKIKNISKNLDNQKTKRNKITQHEEIYKIKTRRKTKRSYSK